MIEQTGADQTLVAVLKDIAAREGGDVLANRRRLIGLLRDKLPEETRAIRMVLIAYDAGVPARLRAHPSVGDVEVAQESHRLSNDTGLSDSFARSAVVAWAQALTGYTPQEVAASSAPASIPPAPPVQMQPLPPQIPPAPVWPVPQSMQPLPPPPAQPLPEMPSVRPLPGSGGPPAPPVQPYSGAHPGGAEPPPADIPDSSQNLPPSGMGRVIKVAALILGAGVLAVAGLLTGVLQRHDVVVSESSTSDPSPSGPSAPAAPKRLIASDGTMLIGGGRYPTIQARHEAGNILTFKFATEGGGDTSYAAAIRYQGTDGGTGAIVAVRNGQTASTGNVPLRRWLGGTDQSVVISGNLANNTGHVRSACVFAMLSKNTSVPETAPGKSFCAYEVKPDGQCDIATNKSLGCAALK